MTPLRLSDLGVIGWRLWDPIGLADADGTPPESAADEYDGYLRHAAAMTRRGASQAEVAASLLWAAREPMGLPQASAEAAARTAAALATLAAPDAGDPGIC